jgi:hypothetical protein
MLSFLSPGTAAVFGGAGVFLYLFRYVGHIFLGCKLVSTHKRDILFRVEARWRIEPQAYTKYSEDYI